MIEHRVENPDRTKNLLRVETHCPGRFFRVVMGKTYNVQGQIVEGTNYNPNQNWNPIIPDTIGDTLYKKLCLK